MQNFEYEDGDSGLAIRVSAEELKLLAQKGSISPETKIRKEGTTNWTKAGNTKGLQFNSAPAMTNPLPSIEVSSNNNSQTNTNRDRKQIDRKNLWAGLPNVNIDVFDTYYTATAKSSVKVLFLLLFVQFVYLMCAVVFFAEPDWGFSALFTALYLMFLATLVFNAVVLVLVAVKLCVYYLKDIRDHLCKSDSESSRSNL